MDRTVKLTWIGYCEPTNKIWGSFYDVDDNSMTKFGRYYGRRYVYVFWAMVGKTISIKRHHSEYYISSLIDAKLKNKYEIISEEKLLDIWPMVYEEIGSKLLFYKLVNSN